MKIIVDAYNVLHYLNATDRITDDQRKAFIKQLGVYARQKGHVLVAVFDGGPVLFSSCVRVNGIMVCYSGPRMSADEFIINYVKERVGHKMLLISSDKALCNAVADYKVESIKTEDFCSVFMQRAEQTGASSVGPTVKMSSASSAIDALMMQVEVLPKMEDRENHKELRNSTSNKVSKKERNRILKLKKL